MIKLTELLNEQESFTATSKKSGETVVFKSKDARDSAVKAGTHSKIKDSDDSDSKKDTPKVNIFKRDSDRDSKERLKKKKEKEKDEPTKDDEILVIYKNKRGTNKTKSFTDKKSAQKFADANDGELGKIVNGRLKSFPKTSVISKGEEPKSKDEPVRGKYDDIQIQDVQDNIDDMPGDEIQDYAESDIFPYLKGMDLKIAKMYVDDIDASGDDFERSADVRNDLKDLFYRKMYLENTSTKLKDLLRESVINEGTRSQVGVIGRNGKIVSAYVHYDGYPSNMKPGLKHHMKSEKDVLKLIKMGGARGIFDDKEIEYYKTGQPQKGDSKDVAGYIKDADSKNGAEFVYLYNMKDKKWYYADTYKDSKLKKLF